MAVVSDFTALLPEETFFRHNGMTDIGAPVFITYSFLEEENLPPPEDVSYDPTSVHSFNSEQREAFRVALRHAESIAGVRFVEVDDPSDASINVIKTLGTQGIAGFASYPVVTSSGTSIGRFVINPNRLNDDFSLGTSWFEVILHELGHALGLKHPFDGEKTLKKSLDNDNNTLMSYTSNNKDDTEFARFDVEALRHIYGTGKNIDAATQWSWDASSRTFFLTGSDTADVLISTNTNSVVMGGRGSDILIGRDGNDVLSGGDGADRIQLSSGEDTVSLGAGPDDILWTDYFSGVTHVTDFNLSEDRLVLDQVDAENIRFFLQDFLNGVTDYVGYSTQRIYFDGVRPQDRTAIQIDLPEHENSPATRAPGVFGQYWQGGKISTNTSARNIDDPDGVIESSFEYQWLSNGIEIPGATEKDYFATQNDVDDVLSVRVTYRDIWGNLETVTSNETDPIFNINDNPTGAPILLGIAKVGAQLTADISDIEDLDGLGAFSYYWIKGDSQVVGTDEAYEVQKADIGSQIKLIIAYEDATGVPENVISEPTRVIPNLSNADPTGTLSILGTPHLDEILTLDTSQLDDVDGMGPLSYQWLSNNKPIAGATEDTYQLSVSDIGSQIQAVVSYTDGNGTVESVTSDPIDDVNSPGVDNPSDTPDVEVNISGTALQGQDLAAHVVNLDTALGQDVVAYQWMRDGSPIFGSNGQTYRLTQDDVGTTISVTVSYRDGSTLAEIKSEQTAAIANINDDPVGDVIIFGDAKHGNTLTVDVSAVSDLDGILSSSQTVQWFRDDVAILDATSLDYTIEAADIGSLISVQVTYTDGFNKTEQLTSAPTQPVEEANGKMINGTNAADELFGSIGSDTILALASDDIVLGNSGDDYLDGGQGMDTAVYSGNQASYSVKISPSDVTVTDRRDWMDGTDHLIDFETLTFADKSVDLDLFTGAALLPAEDFASIVELYIAYFNRAPAAGGLLYWADRLADGMPLPKIAESFFVQPETQNTYSDYLSETGEVLNAEAMVKAVFNNVLGRDPNGSYWTNELQNNPDITPAILILAVLNGAKAPTGGAADRDYLTDKIDIGIYFSAIKGLGRRDDTIDVMNLYNGTAESVAAAIEKTDRLYEAALDDENGQFLLQLAGVVDDPFSVI